ncbi:hypothetical protein E4U55_005497 [Claviceps digitariae]|nr:hypothetical protein E4U55_005497 [Claviceps digitariae]
MALLAFLPSCSSSWITTTPRLRIRRPSPTTAEFSVTTLPRSTTPLRILLLLRVVLALATLLVLHALWTTTTSSAITAAASTASTWTTCPCSLSSGPAATAAAAAAAVSRSPNIINPPPQAWLFHPMLSSPLHTTLSLLSWYQRSPLGHLFARTACSVPAPALLALCLAACYLLTRRLHSTESLLVLRGLGVQTREESSSGTYLLGGGGTTRFIPTEKIQDIFVNEAFRGFEVRYYLVVVVEGEGELVVVFPGLLPRRSIVEEVWRGVRECLYERGREGE